MCQGRCAGCGYVDSDSKVDAHQPDCEGFALAYQKDPASILPSRAEYKRWLEAGKPEEKAQAHAASVAGTDARRAAMADRFQTRDVLDD